MSPEPAAPSTDPLMLKEARQAPQVIARQQRENAGAASDLAAALRQRRPPYAVTVARGSSDHACTVLKYALETQLALPVASLGPSVHTLYGARLDLRGALVIAVSSRGPVRTWWRTCRWPARAEPSPWRW